MNQRLMKYNPAFLTDEELIKGFVVREADLEIILQTIRENTTASNQHILIVGPRGIGENDAGAEGGGGGSARGGFPGSMVSDNFRGRKLSSQFAGGVLAGGDFSIWRSRRRMNDGDGRIGN